jgi:hypothetical protein
MNGACRSELDEAFAWPARDLQDREGGLLLLNTPCYLRRTRSDLGFADRVRRLGLPPEMTVATHGAIVAALRMQRASELNARGARGSGAAEIGFAALPVRAPLAND